MNKDTVYRIIPSHTRHFYIQFRTEVKVFGITVAVWRYVPETFESGLTPDTCPTFFRKNAIKSISQGDLETFISKNSSIERYINELRRKNFHNK